jgi:hypothetical protein
MNFRPHSPKRIFSRIPTIMPEASGNIRYIQKAIIVLVLIINRRHERRGRRQHLIHENKDGLFRGKFNPLANDIAELADG